VTFLVAQKLSITQACVAMEISRSGWYRPRQNWLERDEELISAINGIVESHSQWGFWKCYDRLRLLGQTWNHKRVYRVYCNMNLNQPRRTKKRIPTRVPQPLTVPPLANEIWSIDFMHDTLFYGRRFRTFNVLDEGVREGLGIEIDTSISAERVLRTMNQIKAWRGLPKIIRCDNGPELTAQKFTDWCKENNIEIRYIQPGKPNQNAFIERFNRTYRSEVLNAYLFEDLEQVREITHEWLIGYNEQRPHDALGGIPPTLFRMKSTAGNSTFQLST
jgi:putative transposase